jgi:FecR-like protein
LVAARRRSAAAVVVTALVVTTAVFVALGVTQPPAAAETAAVLTVFTGSVDIEKSHTPTFAHALSGDQVSAGDSIRTGAETKAAITYPSGTVARLDSNTRLTITQLARTAGGGWNIDVYQAVGKSWSRMAQLVGGSSYVVNAPNSVVAEVRGTEFEVIVEARGVSTLVRLDVFAGIVAATANKGSVSVTTGQSTTTSPGLPPTPPAAITATDQQDTFTVFNKTADAALGKPVSVNNDRFSPAQATGKVAGATGDGSTDLQFTLGWPGSRFELTVFDPAGSVYAQVASSVSPVTMVVADASTGEWSYQVTDIQSLPGEVWWVIVSVTTDAPDKTGASASTSPPAPAKAPQGSNTSGGGSTTAGGTSTPSSVGTPPPAPVTPVVAVVATPVAPVAAVVAPVLAPVAAVVAPVLAPVTPVVAAVAAPVAPVVAAVAPILGPVTPIVAAVAPILGPVTPVVAAVAAPLTPVVAAVAPLLAPLAPVVAAVAPLLAPLAPVVAVLSPLLAPIPALGPLLPATPTPSPPPPSPPPATTPPPPPPPPPPAPPPAPPGLLGGLLGTVKTIL